MSNTGITWLHLSDLHEGTPHVKADKQKVLNGLIDDIKHRTEISDDLNQVDFIIFSGDVAFAGKPDQYESAQKFFDRVLEAAGLKGQPERLFIIPGNHDFDRSRYDKLPQALKTIPQENEVDAWIRTWLEDEADLSLVLNPFWEYEKFATRYIHQKRPAYGSTRIINLPGKKIGLLGINSALMSVRHRETNTETGKDGIKDEGHLIVGRSQVEIPQEIQHCDVRIVVMHHPWECLREDQDRKWIKTWLTQNFHFILQGHRHEAEDATNISNQYCIFSAGAAFEHAEHPNGYYFVHLGDKKGTLYSRTWYPKSSKWIGEPEKDKENFILPKGLSLLATSTSQERQRPALVKASIDSHYQELIDNLRERDIVPFLGADINLCDRPTDQENTNPWNWNEDSSYPPTNLELAAFIIRQFPENFFKDTCCPFRSNQKNASTADINPPGCPLNENEHQLITHLDLQHISQYFQTESEASSAEILKNSIEYIYNPARPYVPNSVNTFFASLPEKLKNISSSQGVPVFTPHLLIVTTCFDRSLEKAFENAGQPVDLVSYVSQKGQKKFVYQKLDYPEPSAKEMGWTKAEEVNKPADPSGEDDPYHFLQERPVILRLYGPTDWAVSEAEKFAISEDHFLDYFIFDILHELPQTLSQKLINSHLWFLGYSLSQWNLRGIVRQIQASPECQKNRKRWWAVQERLELLDRELWERQGEPKVVLLTEAQIVSFKDYIDGLDQKLQNTKY